MCFAVGRTHFLHFSNYLTFSMKMCLYLCSAVGKTQFLYFVKLLNFVHVYIFSFMLMLLCCIIFCLKTYTFFSAHITCISEFSSFEFYILLKCIFPYLQLLYRMSLLFIINILFLFLYCATRNTIVFCVALLV